MVSLSDSESGGPGFESRSGHLLDFFLVVPILNPRPGLYVANWLPPTSWGCNSLMLFLNNLFVSKYLSGLPVN